MRLTISSFIIPTPRCPLHFPAFIFFHSVFTSLLRNYQTKASCKLKRLLFLLDTNQERHPRTHSRISGASTSQAGNCTPRRHCPSCQGGGFSPLLLSAVMKQQLPGRGQQLTRTGPAGHISFQEGGAVWISTSLEYFLTQKQFLERHRHSIHTCWIHEWPIPLYSTYETNV